MKSTFYRLTKLQAVRHVTVYTAYCEYVCLDFLKQLTAEILSVHLRMVWWKKCSFLFGTFMQSKFSCQSNFYFWSWLLVKSLYSCKCLLKENNAMDKHKYTKGAKIFNHIAVILLWNNIEKWLSTENSPLVDKDCEYFIVSSWSFLGGVGVGEGGLVMRSTGSKVLIWNLLWSFSCKTYCVCRACGVLLSPHCLCYWIWFVKIWLHIFFYTKHCFGIPQCSSWKNIILSIKLTGRKEK